MGKKKSFIDKKKAATFSLVFRDSSDALAEGEEAPDRIFVRSDGRDDTAPGFEDAASRWGEGSEFTPEDGQFSEAGRPPGLEGFRHPFWGAPRKPLPEHVRKEIIEMGFPDDGYDYTQHMRELRGGGVGAIAVTPEFNLRADVRAYNARSVRVRPAEEDELLAEVEAAEGVKPIAKLGANVLDADILKLLEESGSEGGDDEEEELEDDFVIAANMGEGDEEEKAPSGREHGAVRDWLGSTKEEVGGSDPRLADFEGYEEWSEEEEEEGTGVNGLRGKFTGSSIASDVKSRDRPTRLLDERFENVSEKAARMFGREALC
jgi:protein LTV1